MYHCAGVLVCSSATKTVLQCCQLFYDGRAAGQYFQWIDYCCYLHCCLSCGLVRHCPNYNQNDFLLNYTPSLSVTIVCTFHPSCLLLILEKQRVNSDTGMLVFQYCLIVAGSFDFACCEQLVLVHYQSKFAWPSAFQRTCAIQRKTLNFHYNHNYIYTYPGFWCFVAFHQKVFKCHNWVWVQMRSWSNCVVFILSSLWAGLQQWRLFWFRVPWGGGQRWIGRAIYGSNWETSTGGWRNWRVASSGNNNATILWILQHFGTTGLLEKCIN